MRIMWIAMLGVLLVGCDKPASTPVAVESPPPQVAPVVVVVDAAAPKPRMKEGPGVVDGKVVELKQLQAALGDKASTCEGTAKLLASQGTASAAARTWRAQNVGRLCKADRWPERVRTCAAEADFDQLSCTAYLETEGQKRRWNAVFDRWLAIE